MESLVSIKSAALEFYINGKKIVEPNVEPRTSLLDYMRNKLFLTGSKNGCDEGGCGSCTVTAARFNPITQEVEYFSIVSCITFICSLHGMAIWTIEGLCGKAGKSLHPLQDHLVKAHGSQCGFCTPGMVMSVHALFQNNSELSTFKDIKTSLEGNLCRCTGYRSVLRGFNSLIKKSRPSDKHLSQDDIEDIPSNLTCLHLCSAYNKSHTQAFPEELKDIKKYYDSSLHFIGKESSWVRPCNLQELLRIKSLNPQSSLVMGGTLSYFQQRYGRAQMYIAPSVIKELHQITENDSKLTIGAGVTITNLKILIERKIKELPETKTRTLYAIQDCLEKFASQQIRNVVTIASGLACVEGDLSVILGALGGKVTVCSSSSSQVVLIKNLYQGGPRINLQPEEIITSVIVPYSIKNQFICWYKQALRNILDGALLQACISVIFNEDCSIKDLQICYGSLHLKLVLIKVDLEKIGSSHWNSQLLEDILHLIRTDVTPPSGYFSDYKMALCESFFFKFYIYVKQQLQLPVNSQDLSAIEKQERVHFKTVYNIPQMEFLKSTENIIGSPINHLSAEKQATGEALYCDDLPHLEREFFLGLVKSSRAHAQILSVDPSSALLLPGVISYIDAKDVPGSNWTGTVVSDEEIFATKKVTVHSQVIGAIIATSEKLARRAANLVKIVYGQLYPVIITLKDAISAEAFLCPPKILEKGDVDSVLKECDHVIEGEIEIGGQDHFYMEPISVIGIPKEDNEFEMFLTTQCIRNTQVKVAQALDIPANRVTVRMKRIGGGFGGKLFRVQHVSLPVAVAAVKLNQPVRCTLTREEDFMIRGKRHPMMAKYKVGFTSSGLIKACDIKLYADGGNTLDITDSIVEKCILHCDSAYNFPNIRITGYCCRTNTPSNTACRGAGVPQGTLIGENIIHHIAQKLNLPVIQVQELNMYKEGQKTHFNQVLQPCTIERCWKECLKYTLFIEKTKEIDLFNSTNTWKKRGIAIIPCKQIIAFTYSVLNKAAALVHVNSDGSVLISLTGMEMGQGLFTKVSQVASAVLGIPLSYIYINETSTDKLPNGSATAASTGTDLNGMAVLNACKALVERLEPLKKSTPNGSWKQWILEAMNKGINLSAIGYYQVPNLTYDMSTNSGDLAPYFVYGAACTQVEIDCLTGSHQVLSVDLIMDIGQSINPAIDIGQIEGAFLQGYGWLTLELIQYNKDAVLVSRGPRDYKIPTLRNMPRDFSLHFLKDSANSHAVFSSKGVGEAGLTLAPSVYFAIKNAIQATKKNSDYFKLNTPLTPDQVKMNLGTTLIS